VGNHSASFDHCVYSGGSPFSNAPTAQDRLDFRTGIRLARRGAKHWTMRTGRCEDGLIDQEVLKSVAQQMMSGAEVVVDSRASRVTRTGSQRLRTTRFLMGGKEHQAIEQNPEKPNQWGKLAREGHQVVQFRDLSTQKYVAVAVDGKVKEYAR
jgi:hypothetical protein